MNHDDFAAHLIPYPRCWWRWLTRPAREVRDEANRMRAWTLAVMTLSALPLQMALLVVTSTDARVRELPPLLGISLLFTLLVYGFSRTRWYQLGAALLIGAAFAVALLWINAENDIHEAFVLIIPIVLTSQFFPAAITLPVAGISLAGVMWVGNYDPAMRDGVMLFAILLSVVLALVVITNAGRDHNERDLLRQQQRLAASETRLRSVLQNMPIMLDAFDENWVPIIWNKECERVTGYSAGEIIGNTNVMNLFTPDPQERDRQMAELRRMGNYYRNWEGNLTCKDGTVKQIAWSNIARDYPVPGWPIWGIGVDVTEQKQAESRRVELAVERERVQMLQQFMGDVSHDLMTPITIIKSSLYLLNKANAPEKRQEHVRKIELQTERLEKMIQDMLMMSRLDKPTEQEYDFQVQDVDLLLQEILAEHQSVAAGNRQTITFAEHPAALCAWADEPKLRRALTNLVDNALKYTPADGQITVKTDLHGDTVWIKIHNSGSGIPAEDLPHIFERFYRVEAHRPARGGTGLGLAIARKIVEAHGGSIDATSEPGQGVTVRVVLPLATERELTGL